MKKRAVLAILGIIVAGLVTTTIFIHIKRDTPPYINEMANVMEFLKEGDPVFSIEDAEVYKNEIVPIIEKIAGKKFNKVANIKLVNRNELVGVLVRDLLPQLKHLMPHNSDEQIILVAEKDAKLSSFGCLGKYGLEDKLLYLVPGAFTPVFKATKTDEMYIQPFLKIIIAHELTHALQDQEIDLSAKYRKIKGFDELEAFNATIEGHAVFIQELVGKQMGLDEAIIRFAAILSSGIEIFRDPIFNITNNIASYRHKQVYMWGKKFIEYQHKKGGNELIWKILSNPPSDTSVIVDPEIYSSEPLIKIEYKNMLKGLEDYFGKKEWHVENIDIPKTAFGAIYSNLDPNEIEEIVSNVKHIQALKISNKNILYGSISIIVLKNSVFGSKLISASEKMANINIERIKNSHMYKVEDFLIEDFIGIQSDHSHKISFTIKSFNGEDKKFIGVRICRGNIVLEIGDEKGILRDEKINEIAEKIFQRYHNAIWQKELRKSHSDNSQKELILAA